jgi:hypothetical protein
MQRKIYKGPLRLSNMMKNENNRSDYPSKQNAGPAAKRSNPFIWVSWLSKLMAGEKQCEWACWFRSHYIWEKLPSGLDLAKWTADHTQLLRARKAELEAEGFTVYAEDQNSFTLKGTDGIEVSGKPDIVAIRGEEAYVEDCKTGTPRHSDHFQVLIYMLSLPYVEGHSKGRRLEGRLIYNNTIVDVPSSKIDAGLKELFRKTVLRIGGPEPAEKVPSWGECRYCDISQADCPERIETQTEAVTDHGLF